MKHNDTIYHPIPSSEYSRYELAIIHDEKLRLCWQGDDNILHLIILFPHDLQTQNKAEYLLAHNLSGDQFSIRLDYICRYEVI